MPCKTRLLSLLLLFTSVVSVTVALAAVAPAAVAPATVRIHYSRSASDYAGWQLYTWYGALNPSPQWNHYRITCRDGTITLAVNGKDVSEAVKQLRA